MKIRFAATNILSRNPLARGPVGPRLLRAALCLLFVGAALAPLRAASLDDGFGPLSLVDGAPPVPGGCGRPMAACHCQGRTINTDGRMSMGMGMDMNMEMSGAIVESGERLVGVGFDASPNALTVVNVGASAYSINGASNPVLTFVRGQTYTFSVTASGHPFYIKTVQGNGTGNAYSNGVVGNGTQSGSVTFTVPLDAPSTLFYDCAIHALMTNRIDVIDAVPEPSTWALLGAGAVAAALRRRRARA